MKRIFTIALALIAVMGVNAQSLSVDNINIAAGTTGEVAIKFEAPVDCKALQMTVSLPEGVEIPYNEDDEEYGIEYGDLLHKKYSVDINKKDNTYKFLVYRNVKEPKFEAKEGTLLILTLSVADGLTGVLDASIKDITVNDLASKPVEGFADVEFKIGVTEDVVTGINSINAEENDGAAYNLAGQKVGKNYKGIVVKNGKKTLVK
ncbi:MAG: hypothetical protein IKI06_01800 [Prevotella sp.]|nr:hypothetical protein [Prevotella sp.]